MKKQSISQRFSSRKKLFALAAVLLILLAILDQGGVRVATSPKERVLIHQFLRSAGIRPEPNAIHSSFASQLKFIESVQHLVLRTVAAGDVGTERYGDVQFYLTERKGLCYDRAILMEKILGDAGFRFRHAFIFLGSSGKQPAFRDYLTRMSPTHAAFEVWTQKGWIAVDTNAPWIGVTKDGEALSLVKARDLVRQQQFDFAGIHQNLFLRNAPNFTLLYGLYSRNGVFFTQSSAGEKKLIRRLLPVFPDYDLDMMVHNL